MCRVTPELPPGTQVVLHRTVQDDDGRELRKGSTGRVLARVEDGRYVVRLADGREVACERSSLGIRRALQHDLAVGEVDGELGEVLVRDHTVYAAVVGSRAFNLATDASDEDVRGVFVVPTSWFWSMRKPPTHVDGPEAEMFSWEVERFCELALKANPNVLEVLWSPLVRTQTAIGSELVDLRDAFLSQLVYQTYSGYVLSQFKRLEADLRQHGEPKWKHVMHLLRLLLSARALLQDGRLVLDVGDMRDRLLRVRRGEVPWDEVERWRLDLHEDLDRALDQTPLPPVPDFDRVDAWLKSVRRRNLEEDGT
jgi:hypothetical protein